MSLQEKQFQLGSVVFGAESPVEILTWSPGSPATRISDIDNPTSDGVRMGRDFKGSATWTFSLFTNGSNEDEAWEALADLAEVWDGDEVRDEAGAVLPLRYRVAGQDRRVYGRPTRWTAIPSETLMGGRIDVEADFRLVDPNIYGDDENSKTVRLASIPLDLEDGIVAPFIPPFTTNAGTSVTQDFIEVGGTKPAPITLTVNGPISNARIEVGSWIGELLDPVIYDHPVVIDGRPWIRAAYLKNSGGGVRVSPRVTRISKLWLPPGRHKVVLTGDDPSGGSSVLVTWHEAYRTPR